MEKCQSLLTRVAGLVETDNKIQERRLSHGEKFNVFQILGICSEEVRFHSPFLSGLLDANGSHGQKDAFLQAFITETISDPSFEFDTSASKVFPEYFIGQITNQQQNGGQIDILITSGNKAIIIENKIYAGDQYKQLVRYNNYAKQHFSAYKILYLSLYGSNAAPDSCCNADNIPVDYIPISYYRNIVRWLERCIQLSGTKPLVRETIRQYLAVIKQLTKQDMETSSQKEILELMQGNIPASFAIAENIHLLKISLLEKSCRLLSEDTRIDINDFHCEYPYIKIKYRKLWMVIGGNESRAVYITIRTNDIMNGKICREHIFQAEGLFDKKDAVSWNPFGYRYLNFTLTNNDTFIGLTSRQSKIYQTLLDWILKMKIFIDTDVRLEPYR